MAKQVVSTIKRNCVVCGKKLTISLYKDGTYKGGNYFSSILKSKSKKLPEYWECQKCMTS